MNKLFIKLLRDIRKSKGQFIAISLIIFTGIFFRTGASMMAESLDRYSAHYYEEYNLTDLYVYYSHITNEEIAELVQINGLNKIEGRYTFEANQVLADRKTNITVHSIPKNNSINSLAVIEGNIPSDKSEIIIDSRYAKENGYSIGDQFNVVYDTNEFAFTISGLCENAEHVFNASDSTLMMPDHKQFGIAYISEDRLIEINGDGSYNEVLVDVDEKFNVEEIGKIIESKSEKFSYLYQLGREKMNSYTQVYNNIMINRIMGTFLPIALFFVAAAILMLSLSRIIEADRQQIGIMKSLGISNNKIRSYYVIYAVLASGIGTVLGIIVGYPIYQIMVLAQIEMTYSFPTFEISMDWTGVAIYSVLAIAFCVLATYLSSKKIFKESAAQAMRPKQPRKMNKIFVEHFNMIWGNISCSKKMVLRNIFQSKMRTFFTSVGIMFCVILLIVAFGFNYSMESMATHLLTNIYKYDIKVEYNTLINSDAIVLPSEIEEYSTYLELPVQFNVTENKDTILAITEIDSDLICFYDVNNNPIELDDSGVIISQSYAEAYDLSVGDTLNLRCVLPQYSGLVMNVKISAISLQYNNQTIYCSPSYLETLGVTYSPETILASIKESADVSEIYDYFANNDEVVNITLKSDLKESINESLEQNLLTVLMFILCAVMLSAVAIYIVSSINIFERRRDVATMKVLGYNKNRVNRIVFTENIFITVFSLIIALPLGLCFYEFVFAKMFSTVDQVVPEELDISAIILTVVVTLLVTVITNWMLRKKVDKIDMVESLKSVE